MLCCKYWPGRHNSPYVAGMNATNLPTSTFSVSSSLTETSYLGGSAQAPLGTAAYTLLMWCPSFTAFFGDGATNQAGGQVHQATTNKLGGLVAY